ncbi:MAG: glycosyltransferase family 2 protein [Chthoniobacterales bacterium]
MTYPEWFERYSLLTPSERVELGKKIRELAHQPLISVILPIYNGQLKFIDEAITSIRKQIYENWEICLVDDASTDSRIRPFLEDLAGGHPRINLHFREENGHISACSNSALALARGEWCALLDQDDVLAEHAFAEVVSAIAQERELNILYSDEDFLDEQGIHSNPFFKPDWNPELFLAQNYLNHLGVYRTSLVREIGGFREGYEGSQDYDLALRCVARSQPHQIHHIPHLLYHWRMVKGSLADQPDAKPYARHAARRALNSYFAQQNIEAKSEACPQNAESHRTVYCVRKNSPFVSIITPNLKAFEDTTYPTFEVINSSANAAAANAAAQKAQGEILLFILRPIEAIETGCLEELVSHVVRPEVGAVGGRLWSREGLLEDGGLILGLGEVFAPAFRGLPREHPGYFNRAWLQQNLSAVSSSCLAVRRELFLGLEGFDEQNLPDQFFDVDFCLRLRERSWQVVWTPYANLILAHSESEFLSDPASGATYLRSRWQNELRQDPYYNRNLSLNLPGFTLALPPRTHQSQVARTR